MKTILIVTCSHHLALQARLAPPLPLASTGATGSTASTGSLTGSTASTGSTGASSATALPTGPEDLFGNEVLSSATAGEVDFVAHSATLLAAEDSIIQEERSTKEAGQKAFKTIEKDEDLLQNLTSRYQMALKDKLHALRDLEYSKTRGDDEAMANEKEDIEVDSKKMKLFKVEIK